jgi:hypothetical protein
MSQFLFSFWFMPIFKCNNDPYFIHYPSLRANKIVPSINKLAFIYVHNTVINFWVFKVVPDIIHANSNNVMPTLVIIFVTCWIICWLKNLKQNNNWIAFFQIILKLLDCHILFAIKVINSLKISLIALDYFFKTIL